MLFLNTKEPYQKLFELEQASDPDGFDDCEVVFEQLKRDVESLREELTWFLDSTSAD